MAEGRKFSWQDATGAVTLLSDRLNGYWVLRGVTGLGKPKYAIDTQARADGNGALIRTVRAVDRSIFLPMRIQGEDRDDYLKLKQRLNGIFDPTMGTGYLIIEDGSFKVRCSAIYESGMEGDESRGVDSGFSGDVDGYWATTGINLHSYDPYFESLEAVSVELLGGGVTGTFFPFFPLQLSAPLVLDGTTFTVTSPGNKPTYPVWRITGPATSVIIKSLTLNQTVKINLAMAPGDVIYIDMKNFKVYYENASFILYSALELDQFWPFVKGDNKVQVTVTGASSATSVTTRFYPRMESLV